MNASMRLEFLHYDKCPSCGSRVKSRTQSDLHTCGQWNEYMEFECGCKIHWSPNFNCEEVTTVCPRLPEAIEKKQKRVDAKEAICTYIESLDVDANFMQRLIREIRDVYP